MGCKPTKEQKKVPKGDDIPSEPAPKIVTRKESVRDIQDLIADYPSLRLKYKLLDIVGHGRFGVVYKAESLVKSGELVAIKILKITNHEENYRIISEAKILKQLDHPNIVKYYEEITDGPYLFVVTEFCSGGELLERFSKRTTVINESEAAAITEKILKALAHCHSKGIAHRDIKPENILYASEDDGAEIKLIDFGFAKTETANHFETVLGSPNFIAPEVIDGSYTKSCDIWSVGVVLYIMLSGHQPFEGKTIQEVLKNVRNAKIRFDQPEWNKVSAPGQEFVRSLLETDTKKRPSALEALEHCWFTKVKTYTPQVDELDIKIADSLKKFKGTSRLQKELMNVVVKNMREKEIEHLITAYQALDHDRTGYLATQDILKVFAKEFPTVEIKDIASQIDPLSSGKINYLQFISTTINARQFLTQERMWALFRFFDESRTGYITAKDITKVLNQIGTKEHAIIDVEGMLKEHGIECDGSITFKTFCSIMKQNSFEPMEESVIKVILHKKGDKI